MNDPRPQELRDLVTTIAEQLIEAADNPERTTELLEVWARADLLLLTAAVQHLAHTAAIERE